MPTTKTLQKSDAAEGEEPPRVQCDPQQPKVTAAMLRRVFWLRERRRRLEQQANAIKSEESQINDCILAYLEENERETVKRGDLIAKEIQGAAYPKWKEAFIAECGAEKAAQVQAAAPCSSRIEVSRI